MLAAVGLLVIVGALKFWPASSTPAEAGSGEGGDSATVAAASEPFAILFATYQYNEKNIPVAQATGREVRDLFPEIPAPKLIIYPQQNPDVMELWIGESNDKAELADLLRRVQEAQVSTDKNNPRPFASARIERRRNINAD